MSTIKTKDKTLTDFITIDILSNSSLFAVYIVDLETFEVIFTNQAMEFIMADKNAKNCWESIYAQTAPCQWCKVHELSVKKNSESIVYEHFNEVANKWYQIQEKILVTKKNERILVSFALDISMQKEAQSQLINAHVQLSHQTKALKVAREELREQANHDYLTGLYNRRYFHQISQDLINIAKREARKLSIIMLDIDKFKLVNDTYGHSAGDQVLKHLASTLTEHTRNSDIVARLGGEEFAVLLLNSDTKGAAVIAEKLRRAIESQPVTTDDETNISFTASLGVSSVDIETDVNIDAASNRSDSALYKAKNSGRNKVIVHSSNL